MAHMRAKSKAAKALAARWEGSAEDKAKDRREAKKRGVTAKEFEGSAADEKMDDAAVRKMKKKAKGKKRKDDED